MFIKELILRNFRNLVNVNLTPGPHLNIFLGQNGQGKTNLLESVYLCSHGSSFRPSEPNSFINKTTDINAARINAALVSGNVSSNIQFDFTSQRKSIHLNGKRVLSTKLYQNLPTVLFSPESLSVVKSNQQVRRDFFDELVVLHQPARINLVRDFRKALKTRNRLLKDFSKGVLPSKQFNDLFFSINHSYFRLAAELTAARIEAIQAITPDFQKSVREIFSNDQIVCMINYLISREVFNTRGVSEIDNALRQRAKELQSAEQSSGISLVGPHKHEVQLMFEGKDARYYCSQGQQRTLILALKIAQVMYHYTAYHQYPILLLDDVMSELDKDKRIKLIHFINHFKSQIFVTTTDIGDLENLNSGQIFEIREGEINKSC